MKLNAAWEDFVGMLRPYCTLDELDRDTVNHLCWLPVDDGGISRQSTLTSPHTGIGRMDAIEAASETSGGCDWEFWRTQIARRMATAGPLYRGLLLLTFAFWSAAALPETAMRLESPTFLGRTIEYVSELPKVDELRDKLFPDDLYDAVRARGYVLIGARLEPARFALTAVAFEPGSSALPVAIKRQLDVFAAVLILRNYRDAPRPLRIEGHADASGEAERNSELALRRAEAARDYLLGKGVNSEVVVAVGVGPEQLLDSRNPLSPDNRSLVIGRQAPQY